METARKLLNKKIDTEIEVKNAIIAEIRKTFHRLAALGYAGTFRDDFRLHQLDKEQLSKILTDLRLAIYMWILSSCQSIAEDTHESYPFADAPLAIAAITYLNEGDKSVKSLINMYTNRFAYEAEVWLAIGLKRGYSRSNIETLFATYSNNPYKNPIFLQAVKDELSLSATRYESGGVSYGKGQYTSAENSLTRLGRYAIADTMRQAQWHEWTSNEDQTLYGYNVSRGSNYPCSLCDSMCGFHPASKAWLPPYHSRCCCVAVPVFSMESKSPISALL